MYCTPINYAKKCAKKARKKNTHPQCLATPPAMPPTMGMPRQRLLPCPLPKSTKKALKKIATHPLTPCAPTKHGKKQTLLPHTKNLSTFSTLSITFTTLSTLSHTLSSFGTISHTFSAFGTIFYSFSTFCKLSDIFSTLGTLAHFLKLSQLFKYFILSTCNTLRILELISWKKT